MNSPDTTAGRSSTELDATDELAALDPVAYQAEVASRQAAEPGIGASPAEAEGPDNCEAEPAPQVLDADAMLEVERWIAQKSDELRAQQTAPRVVQRHRTAGVVHADALSRELGATSADLEALDNRARTLEGELIIERQAAQQRAA